MLTIAGYETGTLLLKNEFYRCYAATRLFDGLDVILKTPNLPFRHTLLQHMLSNEFGLLKNIENEFSLPPLSLENFEDNKISLYHHIETYELTSLIPEHGMEQSLFIEIARKITAAVRSLHRLSIVNFNIQPSTILLSSDSGKVIFLDFTSAYNLLTGVSAGKEPLWPAESVSYLAPEQLGLTDRLIDWRSDIYSLGMTFYHMISGTTPFNLELQTNRSQLVQPVLPPIKYNPEVPEALSDIVMMCLAQDSEDRYQSAQALLNDLNECHKRLSDLGKIEFFFPGNNNIREQFHIPKKPYGREGDLELLKGIISRVSETGINEVALISGNQGIGKSLLISEIRHSLLGQRTRMINCQFDEESQHVPYLSLIASFRELTRQLLTGNDNQAAFWQRALQSELGGNSSVLAEFIPELQSMLETHQPVSKLTPEEIRNRINLVLQIFIQTLSSAEYPLILTLDSLQWADPSSLKLIGLLLNNPNIQYLTIIGAYRSEEHPQNMLLQKLISNIQESDLTLGEVNLDSLSPKEIGKICADTFCCPFEKTQQLSQQIYERTQGNPFFLRQLLTTLVEKKLLRFDLAKSQWTWIIQKIINQESSTGIHSYINRKLLNMDPPAQRLAWIAACMGVTFDTWTLTQAGYKKSELTGPMEKLIKEGLVIPEINYARLVGGSYTMQEGETGHNFTFVFPHKVVQQVAKTYMGHKQQALLHLKTGRSFLKGQGDKKKEENLFRIVNHYNIGRESISDYDEFIETIKLNLNAGLKAKKMAAYEISTYYFTLGLNILKAAYPDLDRYEDIPEELWETQYDLLSSLVKEKAESEYLTGQLQESLRAFEFLLQHVHSPVEKATVLSFLTTIYTATGHNKEAIHSGLKGLRLLGIRISREPSRFRVIVNLLLALWKHRRIDHDKQIDFKPSDIAEHNAIFKLIMNLHPSAYSTNQRLFVLLILKLFMLSLRFGSKSDSISLTYQAFGFLISSGLKRYQQGYKLAKTGIEIAERQNLSKLIGLNFFYFGSFINNWTQPLSMANGYLRMAYNKLNECGSLVYAGYSAIALMFNLSQTESLVSLRSQTDDFMLFVRKIRDRDVESALVITKQFIHALQGKTLDATSFSDSTTDENKLLATIKSADQPIPYLWYTLKKSQLCFLFEEYDSAAEIIQSEYKSVNDSMGLSFLPDYYYLYFLVLVSQYEDNKPKSTWKQVKLMKEFLRKMKLWNRTCPENYKHKYLLMKAEYLRIKSKPQEARSFFLEAIQAAFDHGFVMHAGIACERMAEFCLASKQQTLAKFFLEKAQNTYFSWGASEKVKQLSQKITHLQSGTHKYGTGHSDFTQSQDLSAIIKASQMIGNEIVLDRLQKNLMKTMIENSGATKGFLVLNKSGEWTVEAEGNLESEKKISLPSYPLDFDNTSNAPLPLSILRYVEQTRHGLVMKNAVREKTFKKDSYIIKQKPKSVFCSPIIHQDKLIGIFYLENNQREGMFTPERLEILGLFSAQAAISLENAWLYADQRTANEQLQREINERKEIENELLFINEELERSNEELLETQSQLIQSAKLASIGELATGMAHELNQPLMYIRNSAQLSLMEGAEKLEKGTITELLQDIEKSTGSMMNIINHLRDFARHHELHLIPLDIHDILDDSLILINEQLRIRSIELEKEYGEEIPNILGNSQQLEQVFINILTNARDAMEDQPNARLAIKTSFLQLSEHKGEVTIAFIDNGAGISDEDQQKIFDPFFTTKEAGKGTGLGLSISYGIIRDHGGRISVENNRQAGVTFRVILPIDLREVEPDMTT